MATVFLGTDQDNDQIRDPFGRKFGSRDLNSLKVTILNIPVLIEYEYFKGESQTMDDQGEEAYVEILSVRSSKKGCDLTGLLELEGFYELLEQKALEDHKRECLNFL